MRSSPTIESTTDDSIFIPTMFVVLSNQLLPPLAYSGSASLTSFESFEGCSSVDSSNSSVDDLDEQVSIITRIQGKRRQVAQQRQQLEDLVSRSSSRTKDGSRQANKVKDTSNRTSQLCWDYCLSPPSSTEGKSDAFSFRRQGKKSSSFSSLPTIKEQERESEWSTQRSLSLPLLLSSRSILKSPTTSSVGTAPLKAKRVVFSLPEDMPPPPPPPSLMSTPTGTNHKMIKVVSPRQASPRSVLDVTLHSPRLITKIKAVSSPSRQASSPRSSLDVTHHSRRSMLDASKKLIL